MSNYQAELNKASKTVQKQMAETEEKIGEVRSQANKFFIIRPRRR